MEYVKNADLLKEVLLSKQNGKMTKEMYNMIGLMANKIILKFRYSNPTDKLDCLHTALLVVYDRWHNFDENKSSNAFAYFTEVIKRGLAKGFNDLYKMKGDPERKAKFISIDSSNNGNGMHNF